MAQSNTRISEPSEEEADVKLNDKEDHPTDFTERYRNTNLVTIILVVISCTVMLLNVATFPDRKEDLPQWRIDLFFGSATAALLCIGMFFYSNRPRFCCPYCGKHLSTSDDWMCGYCDTVNKADWLGYRDHIA